MTSGATYRIRKALESWYPFAVAVAALGILYFYCYDWLTLDICKQLAGQYLSIFTAFLGFAFASMSTLVGLSDKKFLRGMQQSGALPSLVRYHWNCLGWCAVGITCAAVMPFCPSADFQPMFGAVFMAIGVGTLFATWRIVRLFHQLLRYLGYI